VQFVVTPKKQSPNGGESPVASVVDSDAGTARASVGSDGVPYREWSDLDLVASLIDESGDGYAELYRRHSKSVTATARMILADDGRCDDVVAEVFVELWFHPEKFDPRRGTVLAFLRVKARGRSIDIVRAETARRRREEGERYSNKPSAKEIDSGLLASERALAIRGALNLLPPNEREPIYLAFFSGMTHKAVATQLNLPEGTVKGRIRLGLRRLQTVDQVVLLRAMGGRPPATESSASSTG
jgi:RNA polymerase sigma-70 factor (ECF subfamily)